MPINNISAGLLDEKVSPIFPMNKASGTMGERTVTWVTGTARAARVQYAHGKLAMNVGEVWHPSSIVITMRYTPVVTEQCRMLWQGKRYVIASINGSRREGKLVITCDLIDEGV